MSCSLPDTIKLRTIRLLLASLLLAAFSLLLLLSGQPFWALLPLVVLLLCLLLLLQVIRHLWQTLQDFSETLHQCRRGNLAPRAKHEQHHHEIGYLASQLNGFLDLMEVTLEDLRLEATQHQKPDRE
jgi:dolichol kinase